MQAFAGNACWSHIKLCLLQSMSAKQLIVASTAGACCLAAPSHPLDMPCLSLNHLHDHVVKVTDWSLRCICCMCLQAAQSRLDALEQDNPDDAADVFGVDEDDDEFVMAESSDDGGSNPPHQQKQM
jgi:hypothetical protein